MPVAGPTDRLKALADVFEQLATANSPIRGGIASAVGEQAIKLINDGFRKQRDPYGNAWEPLKHPSKKRGGASAKILRDTGRMQGGFNLAISPDGFQISQPVTYAASHQYGAFIPPHSRVSPVTVYRSQKTSRFVSPTKVLGRDGKVKKNITSFQHQPTFASGITIDRRQMVPEVSTGGMGDIWGAALNAQADAALKKYFKR